MITFVKNSLIKKIFKSEIDSYTIILYLILTFAFIVRLINLNYNSAFNDEAIYIVIGKMGLFINDWWSYGAQLWMAGLPYIYPPMSALAYEIGGLLGSRLLNVIFGVLIVEEVYRFVNLLNLFDTKTNKTAALLAAAFAAFSGIGIFVSKLATYDMPSFLLFMIGVNSFLKAKNFTNGKYYFLSFLLLFLAFLTKITIAIFFPVLFIFSLLLMKGRSLFHRKMSIIYFYAPFVLATILYLIFYWDNLMTYIATHKDLGKTQDYMDLVRLIWYETYILVLLLIPNVILLMTSKRVKEIIALIVLCLVIPVFHLSLLRISTLDKHLYLSVIFLSVVVGYGISFAYRELNKPVKMIIKLGLPVIAIFYLISAQNILHIRENDWENSTDTQKYLIEKIQPGDKILTEEGGAVILALYDKIFPPKSIVTFDWINYSGLDGDRGYVQAIKDEYFDYVELNGRFEGAFELRRKIKEGMTGNYSLVYTKDNYEIYEKNND